MQIGKDVISQEIEGLRRLQDTIGGPFAEAANLLLRCSGKVVLCGIGKSGIVARKIAATLSSTGTPAVYLHPVEAAHGDMGVVTPHDVFIVVSKSGRNDEITKLFPYIKSIDVRMIAITAAKRSPLAKASDVVLYTAAEKEACPMDLVPTTSTTSAMVAGDALAVAVFESRNFKREDFARLHPSGVLGKRLLLTVGELMHSGDEVPMVKMNTRLKEALFEIMNKRLGCTGITDEGGRLVGIITDGDLKRILIKNPDALDEEVEKVMTAAPRVTHPGTLAVDALASMEMDPRGAVTQLFVVDEDQHPVGVIHIHDIVKAGLK
ncbi:hypothetical protein DRQ05_05705 [bacterium]|nr:MAG: hypothetical protein DRQ05_05705 [bacterium]